MSKEAEGGLLRSILGYQLLNLSGADLVLYIRSEEILWSLEQLKREGWDNLEAIEFTRMGDASTNFLLTYRLRSTFRLHQILGVLVQIDAKLVWPSVISIFPEAEKSEALGVEEGITFGDPSRKP